MTQAQRGEAQALLASVGARIVDKSGWLWWLVGWLLRVSTLGRLRHFDHYVTTIGPIIAVPPGYPRDQAFFLYLLHHEVEHVRQFKRFGFGSAWLGVLPMAIVYLLLPLPMGLAWGRYRLERGAMLAELRAMMRHNEDTRTLKARVTSMARQLSGPDYAWAWPSQRRIRRDLLGAIGVKA